MPFITLTQADIFSWNKGLIALLLRLISTNKKYIRVLFPTSGVSKLPRWEATRDLCIELLMRTGEEAWFEQQKRNGRVKLKKHKWVARKGWTSNFEDPIKTKLSK
jgi:hypothetical protein